MNILNYFIIGLMFTFLIDVLLNKLNTHPKLLNIQWGWIERITCVLIWPICLLLFIYSFIKTYFK
jgi:hypothetical protein